MELIYMTILKKIEGKFLNMICESHNVTRVTVMLVTNSWLIHVGNHFEMLVIEKVKIYYVGDIKFILMQMQ